MRILQIIAAFLMLVASPAIAKEVAWTVTQKSGDVRVLRNGLQPASVQLRAALLPGDVVATGANGRAMLTKGDDYVVVAPTSRLVLPKEQQQTGFTRLIQQVGTMLYKVKRTGVPHFAVETPMLAAVVKGTTFTVVVDKNRAAVQVTEGVVEVSSVSGEVRRLVEGGMTVYIGRERPNEIIELKSSAQLPSPKVDDGEAVKIEGSGDVSLSTVANLTGGLVRELPVAPVLAVAGANSAGNVVSTPTSSLTTVPAVLPTTGLTVPVLTEPGAPVTSVVEALPEIAPPVTDVVEPPLPTITDPVVDVVESTLPGVTDPVVDIVETVVPGVTDAVLDVVETTVPAVTEPVVEIVETTVPAVTEPVVEIVETTVPAVTEPVVEIVETTVPAVTEPVVEVVETTVPAVTEPVVEVVETTVSAVTEPVVEIVETTVPAVTEPVVEVVETTVPAVTEPVVEVVEALPEVICGLLCPR